MNFKFEIQKICTLDTHRRLPARIRVVFALHFTNFALDLTPIEAHDVYMKFILNRKWKKADETDYERKTRFTKFVQTLCPGW